MFFIAKDEYKSVGNNNSKTTISKTAEFTYKTGEKPTDQQMKLFSCQYFGPTKDAENTSKLSYVIDPKIE